MKKSQRRRVVSCLGALATLLENALPLLKDFSEKFFESFFLSTVRSLFGIFLYSLEENCYPEDLTALRRIKEKVSANLQIKGAIGEANLKRLSFIIQSIKRK